MKKWGQKKRRRTHLRSSTTCQPTSPAPSTRAGTEKDLAVEGKNSISNFLNFQNFQKFPNFQKRVGDRSRCWEKKFNFQEARFSYALVLSLCLNLLPFVVCLLETLSLLCKSTSRSPLKAKESWTVWSVNTETLAPMRKFVYFAKYRDTCCFSVKIRVFCLGHKYKSILWLPEQWSRGISSDDNRTPKGCHLCAVSEEVSVNLLQFCLQECYKKQKLQINPSAKQIGCSFWNISYVDVSLVVSKMCTFLKTSVDIILIFRPLVIMSSH